MRQIAFARRHLGAVLLLPAVCLALPPSLCADESQAGDPLPPVVVGTPQRIEVQPPSFRLDTPRREIHLVTTGFYASGRVQDLSSAAELASADPAVARVEGGVVHPVANGRTEVLVQVGGLSARVPIEVVGQDVPDRTSFTYGAEVALTRQGCNQGACHGSPSGKGGFRLSLRAYDEALDTETLIRESFNRRVNLVEPEKSLLLRKPLMEVPHGGGRKLSTDDVAYSLLREWIAQGCQLDPPDAPRCLAIEVYPKQRVLHYPARRQQLLVLARFSDGSLRDVTSLASYSSSDEAVATVDASGLVSGVDRGETTVLVRFLEIMETASLTLLKEVPGFRWSNPPEHNFVDRHVFAKLEQLQILPSDPAGDEEFLRRAYLDVIGVLPTVDEVEAFLADTAPDRRSRLIDSLLDRPEYTEFWALKWADLLRLRSKKVGDAGVHKFYRWIAAAVRDNMPYDEFVRQLITATGSTYRNPPANFYRTAADTEDCTETASQIFLGVRIQCAKCHNHPFERWTQDNYYGIGAFFNRVQRKKTVDANDLIVWVARSGEVTQPRTGQQMQPWLPLAGPAEIAPDEDRRLALARWLTAPDNPFFARVQANRLWAHLLGRGIVEPVDDFRDSNPPSNAELLDALADEFVRSGYDQKHLLRTILNSRTYQLSSRKNEFNRDDTKYFSHARTRMLAAEQLLDAICQVTEVSEKYAGMPHGTRATQLPSPDAGNEFLKVFGQPARETACACERSSESNLSQALQMINGPLVHAKIRDEHNRLRRLLAAGKSPEEIVSELYLSAFARRPAAPELEAATAHVASSDDVVRGLEDVCWALLNANEFLFQH